MAEFPADSIPDAKPSSTLERKRENFPDELFDVLVVGAGPTGLACAIEVQKAGFKVVAVDKGCICNSLFHYPSHMTFFTTPELLEIGNIPFPSPNPKPTRNEALQYYRLVAAHYKLDVRQYERVARVTGQNGKFTVHTEDRFGRAGQLRARKLIMSTGYYDLPNMMCIPGEVLSKVHHYYDDPHPYFDAHLVVIGGKISAGIAARE
jgi:thioredoxin reductase (NADPH)